MGVLIMLFQKYLTFPILSTECLAVHEEKLSSQEETIINAENLVDPEEWNSTKKSKNFTTESLKIVKNN